MYMLYIYIYIYIHIVNATTSNNDIKDMSYVCAKQVLPPLRVTSQLEADCASLAEQAPTPNLPTVLRISLLLRLLDSNFPGYSLWT